MTTAPVVVRSWLLAVLDNVMFIQYEWNQLRVFHQHVRSSPSMRKSLVALWRAALRGTAVFAKPRVGG